MTEPKGVISGAENPPVRTEAAPRHQYVRPLVKKERFDSVVRGSTGPKFDNGLPGTHP